MPIYVYECRSCEKVFEVEQRIIEDALTDCEACGKKGGLRRLIQPTAVMFKGSGFYVNDVSKGANPASEAPESKTDASVETQSETQSESKVDTKPEAEKAAKAKKPEPAASKTDRSD